MYNMTTGIPFFDQHPLILVLIIVWSMIWKGIALWKAANRQDKYWYLALLLVNSLGILELLYICFFGNKEEKYEN